VKTDFGAAKCLDIIEVCRASAFIGKVPNRFDLLR
jgi:hypothetical protein